MKREAVKREGQAVFLRFLNGVTIISMYSVFISYRRDCSSAYAEKLQVELIKAGIKPDQIFFDKHSIDYGNFKEHIEKAIQMTENFVVLLDGECLTRKKEDFFYMELEEAVKDKVNIIPLFFKSFHRPEEPNETAQSILLTEGVPNVDIDYFAPAVELLVSHFVKSPFKDQILRNLRQENQSVVHIRKEIERQPLEERWRGAKEIRMCAFCLYILITASSNAVTNFLKGGGKMKVIMNDPDCLAAKDAIQYKCGHSMPAPIQKNMFNSAYEAMQLYAHDYPEQFAFKLTDMYLTCAIQDVITDKEEDSTIKVDLYGIDVDSSERRSFIIPFDDKDHNYKHFHDQFMALWNNDELTHTNRKGKSFVRPQNQIARIPAADIDDALETMGVSQYLTGDLKRPQALENILDGDLEVAIAETRDAESVGIPHYHPIVTEYQYVIAGAADVLETDTKRVHHFRQGDFFVIYPNTHYQMLIKPHSRILFAKYPGMNDKTAI